MERKALQDGRRGWERGHVREMKQPAQLAVPSHGNEAILNFLESFELSPSSPRGTETDTQAEVNESESMSLSRF